MKVRVGFEKMDARILPAMSTKVAFRNATEPAASAASGKARGGMSIPISAVSQRDGRDVVWVVRDGRVERRAVTVGANQGGETSIAAGLSEGERVVVEGADNLTEGVSVTEAKR